VRGRGALESASGCALVRRFVSTCPRVVGHRLRGTFAILLSGTESRTWQWPLTPPAKATDDQGTQSPERTELGYCWGGLIPARAAARAYLESNGGGLGCCPKVVAMIWEGRGNRMGTKPGRRARRIVTAPGGRQPCPPCRWSSGWPDALVSICDTLVVCRNAFYPELHGPVDSSVLH
jgi:hypothetical protein